MAEMTLDMDISFQKHQLSTYEVNTGHLHTPLPLPPPPPVSFNIGNTLIRTLHKLSDQKTFKLSFVLCKTQQCNEC
jgi:hypothetical protein